MAGYEKKPLWHWIVLYILIGAVLYTLVYYFISSDRPQEVYESSPSVPQQNSESGGY